MLGSRLFIAFEAIRHTKPFKFLKKVQEVPNQFPSDLFVVPKKDGSRRQVINLKPLNRYIWRQKFKMEGAQVIKDILQNGRLDGLHRPERRIPVRPSGQDGF